MKYEQGKSWDITFKYKLFASRPTTFLHVSGLDISCGQIFVLSFIASLVKTMDSPPVTLDLNV